MKLTLPGLEILNDLFQDILVSVIVAIPVWITIITCAAIMALYRFACGRIGSQVARRENGEDVVQQQVQPQPLRPTPLRHHSVRAQPIPPRPFSAPRPPPYNIENGKGRPAMEMYHIYDPPHDRRFRCREVEESLTMRRGNEILALRGRVH